MRIPMLFQTSRTAISVAGTNGLLRCLDETTTMGSQNSLTVLVTGSRVDASATRYVPDCVRERWIRWQEKRKRRRKMYAW